MPLKVTQPDPPEVFNDRLLRIDDVAAITTLSKSCIRLWVAQGRFPPPAVLSPTISVWRLRQIHSWIDELFDSRSTAADEMPLTSIDSSKGGNQ